MNDGRIMAVDIRYYSNGGCTEDKSILVNNLKISGIVILFWGQIE